VCSDVDFSEDTEEDCPEYAMFQEYLSMNLFAVSAGVRRAKTYSITASQKNRRVYLNKKKNTLMADKVPTTTAYVHLGSAPTCFFLAFPRS
jgi:hypothetical protein